MHPPRPSSWTGRSARSTAQHANLAPSRGRVGGATLVAAAFASCLWPAAVQAGDLELQLHAAQEFSLVGAIERWDADGNPRQPVDPRAQPAAPALAAQAQADDAGRWRFADLPPGRYDLLLLDAPSRVRVEGFSYPPVLDFDEFWSADATVEPDARDAVAEILGAEKHYENRVEPLFWAGDAEHVRVFVQLLRDAGTTFDAEFGQPVATLRHEVWQYTYQFGGWQKEKRARLLDRTLLPVSELRRWTWVWAAELGGIEMTDADLHLEYRLPDAWPEENPPGLLPAP